MNFWAHFKGTPNKIAAIEPCLPVQPQLQLGQVINNNNNNYNNSQLIPVRELTEVFPSSAGCGRCGTTTTPGISWHSRWGQTLELFQSLTEVPQLNQASCKIEMKTTRDGFRHGNIPLNCSCFPGNLDKNMGMEKLQLNDLLTAVHCFPVLLSQLFLGIILISIFY